MRRFDNYIFDLDATLYRDNGEVEADCERLVDEFFRVRLGFSAEEARRQREMILQKYRYEAQAMENGFGVSEKEFMDYICNVEVGHLLPNPQLEAKLRRLPGRRFVYTDSTVGHVADTLCRLGVDLRVFDAVCDAERTGFKFKFQKESFEEFFRIYGIKPQNSVMFEDSLRNLEIAKSFGMTTVLISPRREEKAFADFRFSDINKALDAFVEE